MKQALLQVLDVVLLGSVKLLSSLLNLLPLEIRVRCMYVLTRVVFSFIRRPLRIARRNLEIAFPTSTPQRRAEILEQSLLSFARLMVDALRLGKLENKWAHEYVDHEVVRRYAELKAESLPAGVLVATGHIGSFELLAHCGPFYGYPMAFVARRLALPRLNRWFCSMREQRGNRVIDRRGAVKEVLQLLEGGQDVGVLFDHNVTRNHAVFVDFLGRPAATTKLIGIAALRTNCVVCVACIQYVGGGRYRIRLERCDIDSIRADHTLSVDEKVHSITQQVTRQFEKYILEDPGAWFWIHGRWKTRPEYESENLYA